MGVDFFLKIMEICLSKSCGGRCFLLFCRHGKAEEGVLFTICRPGIGDLELSDFWLT